MFSPINSQSFSSNNIGSSIQAEANQKNRQVSISQLESDMLTVFENLHLDQQDMILRFFNDVYIYEKSCSVDSSIMPVLQEVLKEQKISSEIIEMLVNRLSNEAITFFTLGKYKAHPQKFFAYTYLDLALNNQWNFRSLEIDADFFTENINSLDKENLVQFLHNVYQCYLYSNDSSFLLFLGKQLNGRVRHETLQTIVENLPDEELIYFTNKSYVANPNKILAMTYLDLFFNKKINSHSLQYDMQLIFKDLKGNRNNLLNLLNLIFQYQTNNPDVSFLSMIEDMTSKQKIDRDTLKFLVDNLSDAALVFFSKQKYKPNPNKTFALIYLNLALNAKVAFKPTSLASSIQESINQQSVVILEPPIPASLSNHTFTSTLIEGSEGSEGASSHSNKTLNHIASSFSNYISSAAAPSQPFSPPTPPYSPTRCYSPTERYPSPNSMETDHESSELTETQLSSSHAPQTFSHSILAEGNLFRPSPRFPSSVSPSLPQSQSTSFQNLSFPNVHTSISSENLFSSHLTEEVPAPSSLSQAQVSNSPNISSPNVSSPNEQSNEVMNIALNVLFNSNNSVPASVSSSQLTGINSQLSSRPKTPIRSPSPLFPSQLTGLNLPHFPIMPALSSLQVNEENISNQARPKSPLLPLTPPAPHVPLNSNIPRRIPTPPFLQSITTIQETINDVVSSATTSYPPPSSPPFPYVIDPIDNSILSPLQLPPSSSSVNPMSIKIKKKVNAETGLISWSIAKKAAQNEGTEGEANSNQANETNSSKKSKKRKAVTNKTPSKKQKSMSYYDIQNFNAFAKDLITVLKTPKGLNSKSKFIPSLNQIIKLNINIENQSEDEKKTNEEVLSKLNEIFKLFLSEKNKKKFMDYMDVYADSQNHILPLKRNIVPLLEPEIKKDLLEILNTCNTGIFKNMQISWENIKKHFSIENLTVFFKNLLHYRTTIYNGSLTVCEKEAAELFRNLTDKQIKVLKKSFKNLTKEEMKQLTSNSYPFLAKYLKDQRPSPSLGDLANIALASAPATLQSPIDSNILDAQLLLDIFEGTSLEEINKGHGEKE